MSSHETIRELARFVLVGISNTAVDFIVLNLLISLFGLGQNDPKFILLKATSFTVAVLNSFIWNKTFVFKKSTYIQNQRTKISTELLKFLVVSLIGLFINTAISFLVFSIASTKFTHINTHLLANIAALIGSACVLISNFLGYKFFVFKS